METACSDVKDNDGGKIKKTTHGKLHTLAQHQQRLLTRNDLTMKLTAFTLEDTLYLLYAFQAQLCSCTGEDE